MREQITINKSKLIKMIKKSAFFSKLKRKHINSNILSRIKIEKAGFSKRFQNILKQFNDTAGTRRKIINLCDFLNVPWELFMLLPNCGVKTITNARHSILMYIRSMKYLYLPEYNEILKIMPQTKRKLCLDENLIDRLFSSIGSAHRANVYLKFNSYMIDHSPALQEVGKEFNITRERIRQIVEIASHDVIINADYIFGELIEEIGNTFYVVSVEQLYNYFTDRKLWKSNQLFLFKMIEHMADFTKQFVLNEHWIITINKGYLNLLTNDLSEKIRNILSQKGGIIKITDLTSKLLRYYDNFRSDTKKILNGDFYDYLSYTKRNIYVVNDLIYGEMMYQVYFGKKLKDVLYWSLKYLGKPMHYTEITMFVNKHNQYRIKKPVRIATVMVLLQRNMKNVSWGTYTYPESRLRKHVSARIKILKMLERNGSMEKDEILHRLKHHSSRSNIGTALRKLKPKYLLENGRYGIKKTGRKPIKLFI